MQRARTWATTCGECPAGTGVRQAGPNKRRPAPCLCGAENGLFTLLPDFGESRFHFMLFLLTGFGRRSLALFNQTIDVTLEILLARFAGGVFVLFHGFGNFMVSTPAANSAPFARPFIPANKKTDNSVELSALVAGGGLEYLTFNIVYQIITSQSI